MAHPLQTPHCSCGRPQQPTWTREQTPRKHFVPSSPELWLWAMPPLWLNHKVKDRSCILCWDFPPSPPLLPCGLFVGYCMEQRHCRLSYCVFGIHGQQSGMYLRALSYYTTVKYVIRCPEMFPLPPPPTCQNKYLI